MNETSEYLSLPRHTKEGSLKKASREKFRIFEIIAGIEKVSI